MYEIFLSLLKNKGVRVVDVCRATGIAPSSMTDWKNGKYTPKYDRLKKIADYFEVPVSVFYPDVRKSVDEVLENAGQHEYYIDPQTVELAQTIMDNPLLRVLFNEASTADPEDIQASYDTLMAMKRKARHYD